MAFSGPAEDRLTIRELYGAYSDATFRCDLDAYLACWSDNGVRSASNSECRGKADLSAHWTETWKLLASMAFFTEIVATEVIGDHAIARVYCREIVVLKSGDIWKVVGQYEDELARESGSWVFLLRKYQLLIHEPKVDARRSRGKTA